MRFRANFAILTAVALAGCSGHRVHVPFFGGHHASDASEAQGQPGGDMRYDTVGYAGWYNAPMGPGTITAAHASLPIGSFVEVTALDSGHTIMVAVMDRMGTTDKTIGLSRSALAQLGINTPGAFPVRVRRVAPLPADQAELRAGRAATQREDAPAPLLAALRRRLPNVPQGYADPAVMQPGASYAAPGRALPVRPNAPAPRLEYADPGYASPGASYPVPGRPPVPQARPALARPAISAPMAAPVAGNVYVHVATVYEQANAQALADKVGGEIVPIGRLWRVRLGPYDAKSAAAARDGAIAAGYRDARILPAE